MAQMVPYRERPAAERITVIAGDGGFLITLYGQPKAWFATARGANRIRTAWLAGWAAGMAGVFDAHRYTKSNFLATARHYYRLGHAEGDAERNEHPVRAEVIR